MSVAIFSFFIWIFQTIGIENSHQSSIIESIDQLQHNGREKQLEPSQQAALTSHECDEQAS